MMANGRVDLLILTRYDRLSEENDKVADSYMTFGMLMMLK